MSLLPSCFAPSKRQRRANNTNDVLTKLDLFLSEVSMRDAPVQKRPRKSSQPAPMSKEVVSLFFITGTKKEENGIEEEYVIAKLFVRPPPRGSYVKRVPAEKKLAVELVHAFQKQRGQPQRLNRAGQGKMQPFQHSVLVELLPLPEAARWTWS
jgi:hypothetical protein